MHSIAPANVVSGATLANYYHFTATNGTTTGATITNQVGYSANSTLTSATNNYGFFADIPADTGRWNFYARGNATNYFAGDTLVGGTNIDPVGNNVFGVALKTEGNILSNITSQSVVSSFRKNGDGDHITFHNNNATDCGSISVTGQATQYNSASDYRLKENIAPLTGATDLLKALKPCVYNFKADPSKPFKALLLTKRRKFVLKLLVEKDGEKKMQAIDTSKLVPLLTAALQEALTEIAELKERVKNLEG